jgi:hypothetical protein
MRNATHLEIGPAMAESNERCNRMYLGVNLTLCILESIRAN